MPKIPAEQLAKLGKLNLPKGAEVASTLKRITGDVWSFFQKPNTWVVVPTSADKQLSGQVARQAADKVPALAAAYAKQPEPFVLATKSRLVLAPTKAAAGDRQASLEIIEDNVKRLREAIDSGRITGPVAIPKMGTGDGNLKWEAVEPILEKHLAGKDVTVVEPHRALRRIYEKPVVPKPVRTVAVQEPVRPAVPQSQSLKGDKKVPPSPKGDIQPKPVVEPARPAEPRKLQFADTDDIALRDAAEMETKARILDDDPAGATISKALRQGVSHRYDRVVGTKASQIRDSIDNLFDAERQYLTVDEVEGLVGRRILPISGGSQTAEEILHERMMQHIDRDTLARAGDTITGNLAWKGIKEGFKWIHPQRTAATLDPTGRLPGIIDRGFQFRNRITKAVKIDEENVDKIIKSINREGLDLLRDSLDGKIDPATLAPDLRLAHKSMREFMDKHARAHNLRARPGDEITLDLTGKPERYFVIAEDEAARTVTVRGLTGTYTPGVRARATGDVVIPFEQAFPRYLHDYWPHMIKGDWWVVDPVLANNPATLSESMRAFPTWNDAAEYVKKLGQKTAMDHQIYIEPRTFTPTGEARIVMSKNAVFHAEKVIKDDVERTLRSLPGMPQNLKISGDLLWKSIMQHVDLGHHLRAFNSLKPRRFNLTGYETDFRQVMRAYIRGSHAKLEGDKWANESLELLSDYYKFASDPITKAKFGERPMQGYTWVKEWATAINKATPSAVERWFDNLILAHGGKHSWTYRRALHNMGQVMSILKLSSPVSALVNLTQTALITFPVLGKHTFTGINAVRQIVVNPKAMHNGFSIRKLLQDMDYDLFVSRSALDNLPQSKISELFLYFFNKAERVNRAIAGLGGFFKAMDSNPEALRLMLRKGGMMADDIAKLQSHYDLAIEVAKRWAIDFTQFRYGPEAMPGLLREPTARLLFQFKPYLLNYLNVVAGLFEKNRLGRFPDETRAKELTRFIIVTAGSAGILSLPFVETIDREFNARTGFSFLDEMRRIMPEKVYNVSTRGLGALLDVDLSTRIGAVADLETGINTIFRPDKAKLPNVLRLSPITGQLMDLRTAIENLQTNPDEASADRLLQVLMPIQVWNLYYVTKQATGKKILGLNPLESSGYVQPGGIYSPLKGGAKITELPFETTADKIKFVGMKSIGLRSVQEANVSDRYLKEEVASEHDKAVRESYRRRITQALASGKREEAQRLLKDARDKGIDVNPSSLKREKKQQQRTLLERQLSRLPKDRRRKAVQRARELEGEDVEVPGGGRGRLPGLRGLP